MRRGAVRILLAEDNITNQQVAVGILKKLGLRADAVANGAEAVKALETIPYDLVLMDVQMPEMDGLEATRHIRNPQSAVRNHQIPIIAMTAHAMQGDREKCLEAGMNDYVSKPISPQALAEVLDKWLPKEPAATTKQAAGKPEEAGPVSAKEPEVPVFDKAGMMARLMDDEDLARTVVEGFLEDIPKQIEALKGYLEAGDAARAERQAHTIKGASANVGGEALRAVAFEMEKAGKTGDLESVTARLPELETAVCPAEGSDERICEADHETKGEIAMKSLVVEDDFTSSLLLQEILKHYGPCQTALDGQKAVEAVRTALDSGEPYDLICSGHHDAGDGWT